MRMPRLRHAVTMLFCIVLAVPPAPAQEDRAARGFGIPETVADIMARDAATPQRTAWKIGVKPKRTYPDRRLLPQDPLAPDVAAWPALPKEGPPPPAMSPQTPGVAFTGATLFGTNPTFAFPPDVMGDVGPAQYIVAVNGRIVSFSKTTGAADGVLNADIDVFFNSVRGSAFTSDPRIRYDRLTQRWFVIIINVASVSNRILFAVSNDATITAGTVWTFYFLQHDLIPPAGDTGLFIDYPTLGIDANALYIGGNIFNLTTSTFINTAGYVVRKSSLTSGGPVVATAFRNLLTGSSGPYTPQGVDNFDAAATQGYFIGVDAGVLGRLVLRRVTDPAGTPTISGNINITVPATSNPSNVRHLGNTGGTNGRLSSVDDRLFQAVIRNGRLWTAHHILVNNTGTTSSPTRNGARWYELQNLTGTPSLVQSGTVYDPSATNSVDDRNYWMPSIMVSGQGHVAMGFSAAGTNEYANAATVGRLKSDPAGTMGTPILLTTATAAYNPSGDPGSAGMGRRWGDYSYTSVDPSDDMTMWTAQEFTNATNSYGVRVVQLLAPPPATPAVATPSSVPTGQETVLVTLRGTVVSGSGFFDPGPGFTKRLAASVSGGVTVSGVTWVNDTTVTFRVTTLGAAPGPRNITVTNPDGQSRTGNGIFSVTGTLSLTSPNGGDSLEVGTTVPITWSSTDLGGDVRITLSRNHGISFPETLFAATPNDGTEDWIVAGPATGAARVRITSLLAPSVNDASNASFAIGSRSVDLTAPAPGAVLVADSTTTVTWTSAFGPGDLRIELSRDGGASYVALVETTLNDGSEVIPVPGPASTTGVLRIAEGADPLVRDSVAVTIAAKYTLPFLTGWNSISTPVEGGPAATSSVYPAAVSRSYTWGPLGYAGGDSLAGGKGYWLKFAASGAASVVGQPRLADTITVAAGWNLLGSLGVDVPVDSITAVPGGILVSPFYVFTSPSYSAADTLRPAKAYWVKASASGQLILRSPAPAPARIPTTTLPAISK